MKVFLVCRLVFLPQPLPVRFLLELLLLSRRCRCVVPGSSYPVSSSECDFGMCVWERGEATAQAEVVVSVVYVIVLFSFLFFFFFSIRTTRRRCEVSVLTLARRCAASCSLAVPLACTSTPSTWRT